MAEKEIIASIKGQIKDCEEMIQHLNESCKRNEPLFNGANIGLITGYKAEIKAYKYVLRLFGIQTN